MLPLVYISEEGDGMSVFIAPQWRK